MRVAGVFIKAGGAINAKKNLYLWYDKFFWQEFKVWAVKDRAFRPTVDRKTAGLIDKETGERRTL
jgi:hypothetical protein